MSLSLRTINAPGVEITEIDRSQYSQTLTGTKVLAVGYADKGEDYATISPTSRSTLINVFGKPTNEAERYFYEACKEVIQQGGELYAARIPYKNDMAGKYAYVDYKLDSRITSDGDFNVYTKELKFSDLNSEVISNFSEVSNDILHGNIPEGLADHLSVQSMYQEVVSSETHAQFKDFLINYEACLDNPISNIEQLALTSDCDCFSLLGYGYEGPTGWVDVDAPIGDTILSNFIKEYADEGKTIEAMFRRKRMETIVSTLISSYTDDFGTGVLADINAIDHTVSSVWTLTSDGIPSTLSGEEYDNYSTGEEKAPNNTIRIIDITRGTYGKTPFKGEGDTYYKECIGLVPVVTTAANALFAQMLLSGNAEAKNYNIVSAINSMTLSASEKASEEYPEISSDPGHFTLVEDDLAIPYGGEGTADEDFQKAFRDSLTSRALAYFPAMYTEPKGNTEEVVFNREFFKQIGIVVFKAYIDTASNNKVNFDAVEAFVGSLDPNATNLANGSNIFIDNIVNTQSEYIRVFSNARPVEKADILYINNQCVGSLGFYAAMTVKNISYKSIMEGLNKIFDRNSDINEKEIDIVVDGGVSTIGAFTPDNDGEALFDPCGVGHSTHTLKGGKVKWRGVLNKFDNFCKNTRKDCMFIADGMRQFCLDGKKRIVRPSKPENTIDTKIVPKLLDMQVLNTNYGAGYCDWFEVVDEFSGDSFWCPPSIKACGVYIYTDKHANYWDAPAGLNRGMVSANDVAFNPNVIQAGPIYLKNWNYAINYPVEGVILEGQKTMQLKPSAFDRVNVRRLFLRLERFVFKTARYFVYEPNTQYTRNRFVDALTPYFSQVKTAGGMYDFKIICDESINTPEVIDNNELRIRIGIKPTKTIEFINVEFVALRTGASWTELTNI